MGNSSQHMITEDGPMVQPDSVQPVVVQTVSIPQPVPASLPIVVAEQSVQPVQPVPAPPISAVPVPSTTPKSRNHPFFDMIDRNCSEAEMINMLQAFCGRTQVGTDQVGRPIYDVVDQLDFLAPVMQVFSYCATNGRRSVAQWILTNFVPLQVSYDNNFCYFDCLKYGFIDIADMIAQHESFNPTFQALQNMLERQKYPLFMKCMSSPYLTSDMNTYRYTFMHYLEQSQYSNVVALFDLIKQRANNPSIEITDTVYPNPRLAAAAATAAAAAAPATMTAEEDQQAKIEEAVGQELLASLKKLKETTMEFAAAMEQKHFGAPVPAACCSTQLSNEDVVVEQAVAQAIAMESVMQTTTDTPMETEDPHQPMDTTEDD